ncbi:MAG: copper chaperone PCu(A)C [Micromonosporaceae bacterium]
MRLTADLTAAGRAGVARTPRRGGALLLAGIAGVAALLAGCSAGQNSQTAAKPPTAPGANADVGAISLRNVEVAYAGREQRSHPEGGTAPLDVRIFNTGATPDTLIGVSSEAADRVELVGEEAETAGVCPEASVNVPPAAPTDQPSPGGTAAPGESPGTGESPTGGQESPEQPAPPAGSTDFTVELPPGSCALLGADTPYHLELTGLREEISPGRTVPITFEFEKAGEVTLEVPVGAPSEGGDHSPVNVHPEEPEEVGGDHGEEPEDGHE